MSGRAAMNAGVNQRRIAASEIAAMPCASTSAIRSFHIDAGPIRAAVCASTSFAMRCGA